MVESLEAALWAFWHGTSFEEAVLLAVNLGDDADTTAAITGQLPGAFYGLGRSCLAKVKMRTRVNEWLLGAGLLPRGGINMDF